MSPALLQLLTLLVQTVLQYAPTIYLDIKDAVEVLTSGTDPTPEQQASIDSALDSANQRLQAAVTAAVVAAAAPPVVAVIAPAVPPVLPITTTTAV